MGARTHVAGPVSLRALLPSLSASVSGLFLSLGVRVFAPLAAPFESLCLPPGQALLCGPGQTSFPLGASVSPSNHGKWRRGPSRGKASPLPRLPVPLEAEYRGPGLPPPPHSTALTPPLPFPQPPPLPAVPAELWEFSGFGLPSPPLASPRPFITLSQIFVLADKGLVLELSLEGQAVRAGRPWTPSHPRPHPHDTETQAHSEEGAQPRSSDR